MNDHELKNEVIKYHENYCTFSYNVLGQLETLGYTSKKWKSLALAYLNAEFTPADLRFMHSTCPKCGTKLKDAPGIGPYCPNQDCDVIDNINGHEKLILDFSQPVSDVDRKRVVLECVNVIMNNTDRHRKEYFAQLLRDYFGLNE